VITTLPAGQPEQDCVGLADTEQTSTLAQTRFADLWRRAVHHNPFIQAFMLNFGSIGMEKHLPRQAYASLIVKGAAVDVQHAFGQDYWP